MCESICEKQVGKYVLNRAVSVPVICALDDIHVSVQHLPYIRMYIRKNQMYMRLNIQKTYNLCVQSVYAKLSNYIRRKANGHSRILCKKRWSREKYIRI